MKWVLFCLMLLALNPCLADENDEQVIATEDQSCAIHYLSNKTKKLWSISVDKSYCHDGWVQGFTSVVLKDSLNRTARTLKGFFHQGYWLSDFPGPIDTFYRLTPKKEVQDFIFEAYTDKNTNAVFYTVATSAFTENQYSAFNLCSENPLLLVVHEPVTDFDQSLFQTKILDAAQRLVKQKCPDTKKFNLAGGSSQILAEGDGPFRASVDMTTEETTLSFTSPVPLKEKLHPTELRRESAERIITIDPQLPTEKSTDSQPTQSDQPDSAETTPQWQSAVDLALTAHVYQTPVHGETIIYIDNSTSLVATRPLPLTLQSEQPLSSGWHLIKGSFNAHGETTRVHILSAKPCLKEWCADEN